MMFNKSFIVVVSFLLFFGFSLSGQNKYGNEWLSPSKTYLKMKVADDGIYKISYEDLVEAGLISSSTDGRAFQMFNYGIEQPIFVSSENFGEGDYIEFYGERNTIGFDSLLYDNWKKDLFNPEYSLVTDTNSYFLTLSPENSNKRYSVVEPDYNSSNATLFPYYLHNQKIVYSDFYFKNVDGLIRYSDFEPSEGFGSTITQNNTSITLAASDIYTGGPDARLSFRIGNNNQRAKIEIRFNNDLLETIDNESKATKQLDYNLGLDKINSGSNTLNLKNILGSTDRHRIAYASLVYPRLPDFQNESRYHFSLPSSSESRLLEISRFKSAGQATDVFDFKNNIIYKTQEVNGTIKVLLNPTNRETKYYITSTSSKGTPLFTGLFTPVDFSDTGIDYLIISNKVIKNTIEDYVQQYADYRSSAAGGNYKTRIIDVQTIYDNFGYGIDRHFMGIKQLAGYMHENWSQLEYVFLIGKGIEYNFMRSKNDVINNYGTLFFIPTFGYLGSDNMLFSEGNYPDPYFAIGRLPARNSEDIRNYLDKVKLHEIADQVPQTIEDKYWFKKILQLGGGETPGEKAAIRSSLEKIETVLSDTILGGDVFSLYKASSNVIEFADNEKITELFNNGISILNFFGHSSANTWEFPIQDPKTYTNYGKFPFVLSLGCYAGNLHSKSKGISEIFALEKDRGSIAFLASSGTAIIPDLADYGQKFYRKATNELRDEGLGKVAQQIIHDNRTPHLSMYSLYTQQTFNGDPAIKIHLPQAPDYTFDDKSIKTIPDIVQGSDKTFEVAIDVVNLGISVNKPVKIAFYHQLADGSVVDTTLMIVDSIANKKTLKVELKNYGLTSVGKNILFGKIDPDNETIEGPLPDAKNNNDLNRGLGFEFYISDNYASIVYPPNFGMINTTDHFVLKASTSSVPLAAEDYIFQIDTTAYFNSPLFETGKVHSNGGLISYLPKVTPTENTVYYWRISPDSTTTEGYKWAQASFAYLPDEPEGWNQSHFFQLAQNTDGEMFTSEETHRKLEFGNEYFIVQLKNSLWNPDDRPGYTFNNVTYGSVTPWNYMDNGLGFIVADRDEFISGINNPRGGKYGSVNPTNGEVKGFFFKTNTQQDRENIIEFLETEVKPGYYLHAFSILKNENSSYDFSGWEQDSIGSGKNIFNVLESMGATKIRELATQNVPYIFQVEFQKEVISEILGNDIHDVVQNTSTVSRKKHYGHFISPEIGPVQSWDRIKTDVQVADDQQAGLIISSAGNSGYTVQDSLGISGTLVHDVSPDDFLKLTLYGENDISSDAPQLNFWRVSYQPLPDAAISFVKNEPDLDNRLLQQGEKLKVHYRVTNVNYTDMDSLLVKYTYTNSENQVSTWYKRIEALPAGAFIDDVIEFRIGTTRTSDVKIAIEINPDSDQPELYKFNNVLTQQLKVEKDDENPLLDITFDGISIMDGDIISPRPEILISLYDENKLLPITNPSSFEIRIDTGFNQIMTIDMNSPEVRFIPGTTHDNTAKVFFTPTFKDGEYTLSVQGKDASDNKSGDYPRSVSFRVINAQSVSNVLNYPNPFSTSTQFIFTLTGQEVPEVMSISIYTLTGKVVKEITRSELGSLHIGVNRTEYKWDGTDDYGSRLANGVYLYKVNVRDRDGKVYDSFSQSKIDSYFKDGFGKLVIIR